METSLFFHRLRAEQIVMQDLIDCLLAEQFFGAEALTLLSETAWRQQYGHPSPLSACLSSSEQARLWLWRGQPPEAMTLLVALRPGITQAWEKAPLSAVYVGDPETAEWQALSPEDFMRWVFAAQGASEHNAQGQRLFLEALETSVQQTALSQSHRIKTDELLTRDNADFFHIMEQWASLRDRPYHPTAKAKQGLNSQDYQHYVAEFARPVTLCWVAVARDCLLCGEGIEDLPRQTPADYLLTADDRLRLAHELVDRGLDESHVALPVHPWQDAHVLDQLLGDALHDGRCRRLAFRSDGALPTSSLRSMTPGFASADYLKLPMAIYSLGASRYLPAVKMINGNLSEALLHEALARDEELKARLFLCDERRWWAFMPPQATLFDEVPRHLSAMVRRYPPQLLQDAECRLLPMAALGTLLPDSRRHFFDDWLAYRALPVAEENVLMLFAELCRCFFTLNFRLFRLGMLGEIHGQNAVLVWKAGRAHGLLLRDHDSLRIHVPTLNKHGMQDPVYRLKPGNTANTLYHQRLPDLLFWLQTLGIQVNLRAIIDTLAAVYAIAPATLWRTLRAEIEQAIAEVIVEADMREMLHDSLFERETWPQKLLITPTLARAGGPGSMPFGKGEVVNPFIQLERGLR
ncbi:IucA/IucC family protein [Lonsdalea quercina]|uniref:IucA/IucC family protein n=1 Tax=Lonsdalea quercina TaxID=71657 RepID=UPI00397711DC